MSSFVVKREEQPFQFHSWHHHPEVELTYFKHGSGIRVIGDNLEQLKDGDLLLLGSSVPHLYRGDDQLYDGLRERKNADEAICIQFSESFCGKEFLKIPEMEAIANLLSQAKKGLLIQGAYKQQVADLMEASLELIPFKKLQTLLDILFLLTQALPESRVLSSEEFSKSYHLNQTKRITSIYDYTLDNFKKNVSIKDMSDLVSMTTHSFCRYFKASTTKTYWQFLIEIRIGYAARLLAEDKLHISEICQQTGFHNLSNFNRHFKNIMHMTPKKYSKLFRLPGKKKFGT